MTPRRRPPKPRNKSKQFRLWKRTIVREIADDLIIDAALTEITREQVVSLRDAISNWRRTIYVVFTGEHMEVGLL